MEVISVVTSTMPYWSILAATASSMAAAMESFSEKTSSRLRLGIWLRRASAR